MGTTHAASPSLARHRAPDRAPSGTVRGIPRQQSPGGSPPAGRAAGGAAVFDQLAREWEARGATVPGLPDPLWDRLITYEHFQRETDATLRSLRLDRAEPQPPPLTPAPAPAPAAPAGPRWTRA
ncbi:hypothetical protein [Streptomyces sp. NBC_00454]|uniref:hypothetical protein n=1 Tax=Streptomyces sp. NBC_00454 TaxID=2975747 RepID=UPI0030E356A0